jgi:hypothetical protein
MWREPQLIGLSISVQTLERDMRSMGWACKTSLGLSLKIAKITLSLTSESQLYQMRSGPNKVAAAMCRLEKSGPLHACITSCFHCHLAMLINCSKQHLGADNEVYSLANW